MHPITPALQPTGYASLYQDCINNGWTEDQLDHHLAQAELAARTPGYIASTLRALRQEGPPVVVVEERSTTTTQPHTIRTAQINGNPQMGRRINLHPFDGDGQECALCQLPPANTVHTNPPW